MRVQSVQHPTAPSPSSTTTPNATCAACLAGLTRPALAAGQSFSRKLDYLGVRACMGARGQQLHLRASSSRRSACRADGSMRTLLHARRPMCWSRQQRYRACLAPSVPPPQTYPPSPWRNGASEGTWHGGCSRPGASDTHRDARAALHAAMRCALGTSSSSHLTSTDDSTQPTWKGR